METTSSVRRPESGTWQSVAIETAAMGGRTGTHDTLWTWQQHEEAVQGPMADYGPGSSMRSRPVICQPTFVCQKILSHQQCVRPESGHGRVWRWRLQQWEVVQGP
ncbi:unnamed protein product [Staurois parvus]|uniref:Uncharacterized protein n=1 Tax=Staurois parvus TaxID=386267 RepID=A0ABN9GIQ7_9NEOB|nr:unnamed protein product [Staurois parvus]